jgi:hypothetical protein
VPCESDFRGLPHQVQGRRDVFRINQGKPAVRAFPPLDHAVVVIINYRGLGQDVTEKAFRSREPALSSL